MDQHQPQRPPTTYGQLWVMFCFAFALGSIFTMIAIKHGWM
jgi:hypothetical protein